MNTRATPDAPVRFDGARTLFDSPRFRLDEERFATPDGPVVRAIVHHPGAVAVIARPAPDRVLLVRQYRYAVRRWTVEIPAGTRIPGEDALLTAQRELREEAGVTASGWTRLGSFFPTVGICDEELVIYQADGLAQVGTAREHGELVAPTEVALSELSDLARSGEICDAKTLIALAWLGVPLFASGADAAEPRPSGRPIP